MRKNLFVVVLVGIFIFFPLKHANCQIDDSFYLCEGVKSVVDSY